MDKVTFSNRALSRIGAAQIGSLSENSESAYLINLHYESSIREVLAKYKWRSAIKTETLVQAAQEDDMPADYRFFIPTDNCRFVVVLDDEQLEISHVIEGRYIYTNSENTTLKYIAYNELLIGYTEELIEALTYNLAVRLPLRLGKSPQLLATVEQLSRRSLLDAMKVDRVERRKDLRGSKSWGAKRSERYM